MSEVDDLADLVYEASGLCGDGMEHKAAATAIIAAGWSRPRVVTTAAELDELPPRTVLGTSWGGTWVKGTSLGLWAVTGEPGWLTAEQLLERNGQIRWTRAKHLTHWTDQPVEQVLTVVWAPPAEAQGDRR